MTQRTRDDESAVEQDADEQATDEEGEGRDDERAAAERGHLDGIEDGCGCAEVWEHLSEQRAADARTVDSS